MSINKKYSFRTEITPETEILLSGRSGNPLSMSFDDGLSSKTVVLYTESIIRLQTFLSDYLQKQESVPMAPSYEPTGRAIAVMDGDTLDIIRVFRTANIIGFAGAERDSYEALSEKVRSIADIELPSNPVFVFFDSFDGSISRSVLRRILRACISYQVDYVKTGKVERSRRMVLKDIEDFTTIDSSLISRATRNVLILSPAGVFTMNATDASLDRPSLFDEGSKTIAGQSCSRKEVLSILKGLLEGEDKTDPITDEGLSKLLRSRGYLVARRTVTKYRELLGFPKRADRRVSNH